MMIELHNERRQSMLVHNMMVDRLRGTKAASVASAVADVIGAVVAFAVRIYIRRKVYNELAGMSDRMLADIGVSREEIGRIAEMSARKAGADEAKRSEDIVLKGAEIVSFKPKKVTPSLVVERDAA